MKREISLYKNGCLNKAEYLFLQWYSSIADRNMAGSRGHPVIIEINYNCLLLYIKMA